MADGRNDVVGVGIGDLGGVIRSGAEMAESRRRSLTTLAHGTRLPDYKCQRDPGPAI